MKVTDEMVDRVYMSLRRSKQTGGWGYHNDCPGGHAIRKALEAALEDVPDPEELEAFHLERHTALRQDYARADYERTRLYAQVHALKLEAEGARNELAALKKGDKT